MITVTILTKNSQETLASSLQSVASFKEVIILDTGSTDLTLDIAATFPNVKIITSDFIGFGPLHNLAAEKAHYDWILSLDSDEVLTKQLSEEILELALDPSNLYSFPFKNYFRGKLIKGCGWSPDRHIRLYNKKRTSFSPSLIHERVLRADLKEKKLKHPAKHYSYRSIADLLSKMDSYSSLFAQQNRQKKRASLTGALLRSAFAFFRSYFFKRGFLDGPEGMIISIYNAQTTYYKYLKLQELNQTDAAQPTLSPRGKG